MGAASTVPVDSAKRNAPDDGAQPKNVFSDSIAKSKSPSTKDIVSSNEEARNSEESKPTTTMKRKYSLETMTQPVRLIDDGFSGRNAWLDNIGNGKMEVGDVVRLPFLKDTRADGLVIEIIGPTRVLVDFGDFSKEVDPDDCELVTKVMDFEEGDKVEVKPAESQLYFIGKIIKIHSDKTMDVLMDGDDPDDIEFRVSPENTRKLMSRRALVVNRWKRAFMMVLAANFFRRIYPSQPSQLMKNIDEADAKSEEK